MSDAAAATSTPALPALPTPWVTRAVLALNVLWYALAVLGGGDRGLIQMGGEALVRYGANVPAFTLHAGEWELLCTSTFLHAGLWHLGFNMFALWQVGPMLERTIGPARFAMTYAVSGLVASGVSTLAAEFGWLEVGLSVGASGALCGLIGACAVFGYRIQGKHSPLARAMLRWLLITVGLGYVISLAGPVRVDNYAHIGGALCGAAMAASFKRSLSYSKAGRALRIALPALWVVASFAMLLYRQQSAPMATMAKMLYLTGQCDAASGALQVLGLPESQVEAVARSCAGLREH